MNESLPPGRDLRVALPVYGSRVLPRFCLARSFCVAQTGGVPGSPHVVETRVWDPTEAPSLAGWLRSQGVSGVVCGGIHPRHQVALEAAGLWVAWGYRGQVEEVLGNWLQGQPGEPRAWHCQRQGCAPQEQKGEPS